MTAFFIPFAQPVRQLVPPCVHNFVLNYGEPTGDTVDVHNVAQAGAVASRYPPRKLLKLAALPCLEQTNSTRLDVE